MSSFRIPNVIDRALRSLGAVVAPDAPKVRARRGLSSRTGARRRRRPGRGTTSARDCRRPCTHPWVARSARR